MCTVILVRDVVEGFPLVIAANRDEMYERPTDGAQWIGDTVVSGVDRIGGGTWMGATRKGFVVAITNQRTWKTPDPTKKSRGAVVRKALEIGTRDGVREMVEAIRGDDYNGFNLIWGDAGGAAIAYVHGGATEIREVEPGVTVIANDRVGSTEFPRASRAERLARAAIETPMPHLLMRLADILSDHELPAAEATPVPPAGAFITAETARLVQAICIHTPLYGTRSATLAAVAPGGLAHYLVSPLAPCRSPMVDASRLALASGSAPK